MNNIDNKMISRLMAGAAVVDITPKDSQFLYGYPHIERNSIGVHDPLLSSALYITDGRTPVIFVANDVVFINNQSAQRIRERISRHTGIPVKNIMISATHTHSGPMTTNSAIIDGDPVVPRTDSNYVQLMENGIIEAAIKAHQAAQPAQIGMAIADGCGVGTNRRSPDGPSDPQVPVLLLKTADGMKNIACMIVCSVHPTVLHEDSKLVSADFPGMTRIYVQKHVLSADCPLLHHTGCAGNQSPRHVTKANTFDEAQRLGEILGKAIEKALPTITFEHDIKIQCGQILTDLPKRPFPPVPAAQEKLNKAIARLKYLRNSSATSQEIRTAECDWFGAEETLTLAKAVQDGRLAKAYEACLPAEVQAIKIGSWAFVGWPGEAFVDYALEVKKEFADTFVITCANGVLQEYIVTKAAADEGGYESSNAIFSYQSGAALVQKTTEVLNTF